MVPGDLEFPDLAEGDLYRKKGDIYQWFQHVEPRGGTTVAREIVLNTKFGYLSAVKRRELPPAEAAALLAVLPSRGFRRMESRELQDAVALLARCRAETLGRLATARTAVPSPRTPG
jgi:hypothetical protein